MKLTAVMNTRNELERHLRLTVPHLLTWCDEVVVQDDGSSDGTLEYLDSLDRVMTRSLGSHRCQWAEHEGDLHQALLDYALDPARTPEPPTHVIAIDADEIVPEGEKVRKLLEMYELEYDPPPLAYTLRMVELWATEPAIVRHDGGWRPHPVAILYRVPERRGREWAIAGRKLASPRVPRAVVTALRRGRAVELAHDVLHLGWSRPAERGERHRRYDELDGGKYHAKRHLDSILWPDEKCDLRPYEGTVPTLA